MVPAPVAFVSINSTCSCLYGDFLPVWLPDGREADIVNVFSVTAVIFTLLTIPLSYSKPLNPVS